MDRQDNNRNDFDSQEIARRIDEVETRIEAGDYHGAVRAAELLASEVAGDADVLSCLARARLAAGDSDSAADACAQLLALSPEYAEAARLLEECRLVSPVESSLGMVTVRGAEPDEFHDMEDPPALEAPVYPAATALRQRVDDLLSQARIAGSHGRIEEALGLLSRLLILDDQNPDALAFEDELRTKAGAEARSYDEWLNQGVQCLEEGRFDDARQLFLKVLERSPGHSEALDFLEKADAQLALLEEEGSRKAAPSTARRASVQVSARESLETTHNNVWTPATTPEAPAEPDQQFDIGGDLFSAEFELEGSKAPEAGNEPPEAVEVVSAARPLRRVLTLAAAAVLLAAVGGFAGWKLLSGGSSSTLEEEAAVALPKTAGAKAGAVSASHVSAPPATAAAVHPEERSKRLARTLARGTVAFEAADYEQAILAYNDALALDPGNATARQGLLDAAERYKARKAQSALFEKVRKSFDAGEYEAGLRMIYRLPEGAADATTLVRYKVAGWYNMGVIALRAADCAQAQDHLREASALQPADPSIREARSLAEGCATQRKDRAFYDSAEALQFRSGDQ